MQVLNRLFGGGGSDRGHINVSKDDELDRWARRLGATKNQVRVAAAAVGDDPEKIAAYLKRRWATRGWTSAGRDRGD